MAEAPALLDGAGRPIPAAAIQQIRDRARGPRMGASLAGGSHGGTGLFPYDAASWTSPEMGGWNPYVRSPDSEINLYRDRMVARQRDLVRNDGWAAGAVNGILDSTIGVEYRLISKPDYRALSIVDKAFDAEWAAEFRSVAEALWRGYSADLGHYNDVSRRQTVSQQFRVALRHKLVDGEALGVRYWLPDRIGVGQAAYASSLLVVDPDRLSNENLRPDSKYLRGGVEIDDDDVPQAYFIRRAHQNDWFDAQDSMIWDRVAREDDDGFLRVVHDFDRDRAGQNRGVSVFAPILSRMKMLAEYYGVELQAAQVASVFGTFITSPFDRELVEEALSPGDQALGAYQELRNDFHEKHALQLNRVRIPTLAPGEDIKTVAAARPHDGFSPFTHEMLRSVAAALGVSAQTVHQDYSELNYSSARAAIVEAEKGYNRRCAEFDLNFATPVYAGWLHEAMDAGELPMPRLARTIPSFLEARNAYARCRWLGPARGWVDPVKERQGAVLGMDAAIDTLEEQCAQQGSDWEENLEQRAREHDRFKKLGLPLPQWIGPGANATESSQNPEKPEPA
jgi:lambda family phage portal protein